MEKRTDLAFECYEQQEKTKLDGVIIRDTGDITTVEITNVNGSLSLGKPIGKYITYKVVENFEKLFSFENSVSVLKDLILRLLPIGDNDSVLVACLGNSMITADSIGPKVFKNILATRHLAEDENLSKQVNFRSVSTVCSGVLAQTGIESGEIIEAIVSKIKPQCVIAVDALAASSCTRLGNTIQISDSGIVPGSGVGNHRFEISEKTLGIPVVSIGIPTVVDTSVIVGEKMNIIAEKTSDGVFVTPREIDKITTIGSRIVSMAINCALQQNYNYDELTSLLA